MSGDYLHAVRELEQEIRLHPDNARAWNDLAFHYGKAGKLDLAEQCARKAIELAPDYPTFYNGLVGIWLEAAWKVTSCNQLEDLLVKSRMQLAAMMKAFSDYPPLWLNQALLSAFSGEPEIVWRRALEQAEKLYRSQGDIPARYQPILAGKLQECRNAAELRLQLCGRLRSVEPDELLELHERMLADALKIATDYKLVDFVILFVDLRDPIGSALIKGYRQAFGETLDVAKIVADAVAEGRYPICVVPKELDIVCDWLKEYQDIVERLQERLPAEIVKVLVFTRQRMNIFKIPRKEISGA